MNQTSNQQCYRSQFSYLRKAFWPIENVELGRFIQMALLLFLILFNYTLLRNMKDTLVIATPISGSEVIPFLKLWLIMPSAIIFFFGIFCYFCFCYIPF
jgi:AAA family ATP:ADP antiporter